MRIYKLLRYLTSLSFYEALVISNEKLRRYIPDRIYLKMQFRVNMRQRLDLKKPTTFNQKLQWLKLYDRKPQYTIMVDKYAVKKYVSDIVGEEYIIPTLGVWDHFDDIDFDKLPDQFVLKCTHDSGSLVICNDKTKWNRQEAKEKIESCLEKDFFDLGREWPYKDVPRRIIAEPYMQDLSSPDGCACDSLKDYKIFCFDGQPKFVYYSEGLGGNHKLAKISFLNLDWSFTPFQRSDYPSFSSIPPKPKAFDIMLDLAGRLSMGIPHVRVDLYYINEKIYFGEFTFFTSSGMVHFYPTYWDEELGNYINLPRK